MRPVAIFRHSPTEGPGYFAIFLERHGIPWRLIAVDAGEPVPPAEAFSGLCFMGGPMSVNDPPWIDRVCALIRDASAKEIPVIGHCLGGQLMSKALGGEVTRNPVKEIGWGEAGRNRMTSPATGWANSPAAPAPSSSGMAKPSAFLPAPPVSSPTPSAPTRRFVCGPHLAMQCHVEMTPEMIATWCAVGGRSRCRGRPTERTESRTDEGETAARLPHAVLGRSGSTAAGSRD